MKVISMRGKKIDMATFLAQQGNTVALGGKGRSASLNARGDRIDSKGNVILPRESIQQAYNKTNPNAVKQISLKDLQNEVFETPAEVVSAVKKNLKQSSKKITDSED